MQNALAILPVPVSVPEGTFVPLGPSDGAFAEAFADVLSRSEGGVQPIDPAMAGLVVPVHWGELPRVRPELMASGAAFHGVQGSGGVGVDAGDPVLLWSSLKIPVPDTVAANEAVQAATLGSSLLANSATGPNVASEDPALGTPLSQDRSGPMLSIEAQSVPSALVEAEGSKPPGDQSYIVLSQQELGTSEGGASEARATTTDAPAEGLDSAGLEPANRIASAQALATDGRDDVSPRLTNVGWIGSSADVSDRTAGNFLATGSIAPTSHTEDAGTGTTLAEESKLGTASIEQPVLASSQDSALIVQGDKGHPDTRSPTQGLARTESLPSAEVQAQQAMVTGSFWERFLSDTGISKPLDAPTSLETLPQTPVIPAKAPRTLGAPAASLIAPVVDQPGEPLDGNTPSTGMRSDDPGAAEVVPTTDDPTLPETRATPLPVVVVSGWTEDPTVLGGQADIGLSLTSSSTADTTLRVAPSLQSGAGLPVQQVASQLTSALVRDGSTMTELALAPEELGRVRLRMEPDAANPDRMVILISVERPETLDLFRRHAGELADAIRAAGYAEADIGFGHDGKGSGQDHPHARTGTGRGSLSEDPDHPHTTPSRRIGASLDLRL